MSHAEARLVTATGTEYHGEYNGTSDILMKRFYVNPEDRDAAWRNQAPTTGLKWSDFTVLEPAYVYTSYAHGYGWAVLWAPEQGVVLGPLTDDEEPQLHGAVDFSKLTREDRNKEVKAALGQVNLAELICEAKRYWR